MVASLRSESPRLDAESAVTLTIAYDPSQLPADQFTFSTNNNLSQISQTTSFKVAIAAPGGTAVVFNDTPIVFTPPPDFTAPQVTPLDGQTIAFELDPPDHYFAPWSFQVRIDATIDDVVHCGLISPSFFVSLPPNIALAPDTETPGQSLNLAFDPDTGSFDFDNGIALEGGTLVFVNTIVPLNVNITLDGADRFFDSPITFNGGQPPWLSAPTSNADGTEISFTIGAEGLGLSSGFHFVIVSDGLTISSPDPILVNATLGDGT